VPFYNIPETQCDVLLPSSRKKKGIYSKKWDKWVQRVERTIGGVYLDEKVVGRNQSWI